MSATKLFSAMLVSALLSACATQVSNDGKTLQAQAAGAPAHSALNQRNIISPAHRQYRSQANPVNNAFRGVVGGAVLGNVIGEDTESTVYGAAAGGLIGYGTSGL